MTKRFTTYAPASIGNLGLGFDVLGAALKRIDGKLLGDRIDFCQADSYSLQIRGPFADKLPVDSDSNIVTQCYRHFIRLLTDKAVPGKAIPAVSMCLHKHLPIGSGLGSSASSIVAATVGLNKFYGCPFSDNELLLMMGELEGQISGSVHYDNVAPCFLGGLRLMSGLNEKERAVTLPLPLFENWYWVLCYSGCSVSTTAARNLLPKQVSLADTISFGRQLAVFVDALHRGDKGLAARMMTDVVAEPHRKSLLPNFDRSRLYALQSGALAFGISGSGPTVFAVCEDLARAQQIDRWLAENYVENQSGFSHICQLDTQGALVTAE